MFKTLAIFTLRNFILEMAHDSGEHFGINKTLEKIRKRFYWVTCKHDIYNVGASFDRVQMDVLDFLSTILSGNQYLLIVIDCFTKFKTLPLKNIRVNTLAKAFVNQRDWDNWILIYLLAYRLSRHEATGVSPVKLYFAQDLRLPLDLLRGSPSVLGQEILIKNYVKELKEKLKDIHRDTRQRLNINFGNNVKEERFSEFKRVQGISERKTGKSTDNRLAPMHFTR
ncbi:hypothetical protein ACFW04_004616 [Cataglyphis niger]